MSHHMTQVVDLFIQAVTTYMPTVAVYDNDALAIDDPGESIGIYAVAHSTLVEGEQRFKPTYGNERTTVVVVARASTTSLTQRRDALELVGLAQNAIYASQTLDRTVNSIERTELTIDNEIRSEGQTALAVQTYSVGYLTLDSDYQIINN